MQQKYSQYEVPTLARKHLCLLQSCQSDVYQIKRNTFVNVQQNVKFMNVIQYSVGFCMVSVVITDLHIQYIVWPSVKTMLCC